MANKFFLRCVWLRWTAWRYPASFVTQNRRIHFWSKKRQRKSWSNKRRPRRQLKHERELNVISPESLDKPREDVWLNRQKEWRWFALFRFETSTPAPWVPSPTPPPLSDSKLTSPDLEEIPIWIKPDNKKCFCFKTRKKKTTKVLKSAALVMSNPTTCMSDLSLTTW